MRPRFGTDGVRGVANQTLTPDFALRLGLAAGRWIVHTGAPLCALIASDTRRSGPMLTAALASGLCSAGVDVTSIRVGPTGAVSALLREGSYGLGVVVSASHNPAPDNGIKLFACDGRKMDADAEAWIETRLDEEGDRPTGGGIGRLGEDHELLERYLDWLVAMAPERLDGMKIALDAAHGAAHWAGPELLGRLGAEVHAIGCAPDGMNINAEVGATKPQVIQDYTRATGADVGLAFDGDADRVVFADARGRLINGDRTMAIWCAFHAERGDLEPPVVVGTVMSNGGFERNLQASGVRLERTAVGDKHVSKRMDELGALVGGEQSGHLIFSRRGVTGDGLVTALEFLRVLRLSGKSASEWFDAYEAWPQAMVNLSVPDVSEFVESPTLVEAVRDATTRLEGQGRLNVRPSGTQPMVRLMVEADDEALRDEVIERLVDLVCTELGGSVYSRVDLTHSLGE